MAIVGFGRRSAMGAVRRVEAWRTLWQHAGADVRVISLLDECTAGRGRMLLSTFGCVRDDVVPETVLWSKRSLRRALADVAPDIVVFYTARAYHPRVVPAGATPVLDYVDQMSQNYRERAGLAATPVHALGYRVLAAQMARFERRQPVPVRTAAGWFDARALDAEWLPNLVETPGHRPRRAPTIDVLFLGTLDYSPNVAALRRLMGLWPRLRQLRPDVTMLVAGANPSSRLRRDIEAVGWELAADFPSLAEVCDRARIAVAPVRHATGLQWKALDAAAFGLPQVIDPSVAKGLDPQFPVVVAEADDDFVREVARLLGDEQEAAELGQAARGHVAALYSPWAWTSWARSLLDTSCAALTHDAP